MSLSLIIGTEAFSYSVLLSALLPYFVDIIYEPSHMCHVHCKRHTAERTGTTSIK